MNGRRHTCTCGTTAAAPRTTRARPAGRFGPALCGRWEHEPPCRWPHNNSEPSGGGRTALRTVFVASPDDDREVRQRIESVLR
jgi:hypothetical protein